MERVCPRVSCSQTSVCGRAERIGSQPKTAEVEFPRPKKVGRRVCPPPHHIPISLKERIEMQCSISRTSERKIRFQEFPRASTKACLGIMKPKSVVYKLEIGPPKF